MRKQKKMFGLGTLPLSLMLLAIMLSINNHASAQIGITLGLQPSYSEQVEAAMGERVTDFPMFIMQHGTVGVFFRFNTGGRLYFQPEVNASLDANWSYASEGNGAQEEFERAFATLKSIHIDVPVYVGVKVLSMKDLKLRVFGCPQWSLAIFCFSLPFQNFWQSFFGVSLTFLPLKDYSFAMSFNLSPATR